MIHIIAGTRPNFVKIAPLIWEFRSIRRQFSDYKVIHTGQHYDYKMSKVFFEELDLDEPDYYLNVGSGTHIQQVTKVMSGLEKIFLKEPPDKIVVVGDVNSTLGGALAGAILNIPVYHIESGLRCFYPIPEELNRIVTDRVSDIHFVSEFSGMTNLKKEGRHGKFVGNIMIDTLIAKRKDFKTPSPHDLLLANLNSKKDYVLVTLHRPENVDKVEDLKEIIEELNKLDEELIFPAHPKTREMIDKHKIRFNGSLDYPKSYLSFMGLLENAKAVITDSGGVQEESTYLGVQCITLMNETERPITINVGTNQLCERDVNEIRRCLDNPKDGIIPDLWDGNTAKRIVEVLI